MFGIVKIWLLKRALLCKCALSVGDITFNLKSTSIAFILGFGVYKYAELHAQKKEKIAAPL